MRKVELRMKEQQKYEVIKELYDHKGNKKRAAQRLGVTVRTINRLLKTYEEKGKAGFIHGNRNRQPVNSLPQELIDTILNLYNNKYQGWNFAHFVEYLESDENIIVSYSAVYDIMTEADIDSPHIHKKTKKDRAKARIKKEKATLTEEEVEEVINYELSLEDAHPRKERSKYFGERVEMDGSLHKWFGGFKTTLHLSIDHATGNILGGRFEMQETLIGYYHVLKQILENHGVPMLFFTDNRTVFNYEKANNKQDDKDVLTQFGYACKKLGIALETSSVSQAKGMIERANQTFQRRLVNELALHNITDIDAANEYLTEVFIPEFNRRFGMDISSFESVMAEAPSPESINTTLAILSPRVFDNGSSIKFKNNYYQAHDSEDNLVCIKPKKECLVIQAFDGELYVTVEDSIYKLVKVEKNARYSDNFDVIDDKQEPKPKKIYIPPMEHPWKRSSFIAQQEKAHRYHQYGY